MATIPPSQPQPTPPAASGGMIDRIKNILLTPKTEWSRIDAEPMTEQGIFTGWVLPLAAIGPIASVIGMSVIGITVPFVGTIKVPFAWAVTNAVMSYVLAIVGVWVMAKIVDALAPSFDGVRSPVAATKVVAFSYTASFIAGIFGLIPMLGIIGLLFALWGLYIFYLGLPKLMKSPPEKALGYTIVSILCAIVLYIVIGFTVSALTTVMMGPMYNPLMAGATMSGTLNLPGGGTVDLAKLDAASKQMEASAKAMEASATAATAGAGAAGAATASGTAANASALAALLPTATGGWNRTSIESSSAGAAGVGGSVAKGEYAQGDDRATLSVTDMGAMGAIAGMAGAMNVQSNKTTTTGYERTTTVDGRMTSEKWDTGSRSGSYSTIVGNRFMVEVEGNAANADALKALAGSVNLATLAGMAK